MTSQGTQQNSLLSSMTILKQLNQAKFGVYLAHSSTVDSCFALKIFPFVNNKINPHFLNEIRFANLSHPNIISTFHHVIKQTISLEKGKRARISATLMELAPYGDFFDVLMTRKIAFDEKLARTYFHQLINGLEYLHNNRVAHMDIKPDNLLLDQDFQLKIADFDCSVMMAHDQDKVYTAGTLYYRAPEIISSTCQDARAADLYSSAVVLFLFKSGGYLPHLEQEMYEDFDLLDLLNNNNNAFWQKHCKIQTKPESFFDEDFQSLFNSMTKADPKERSTLGDVKNSRWFNGPVYTSEELVDIMKRKMVQ